ncbi:hypothetical protein [Taibaiella koreensis]|uniref:hypothetical protein n=1 Tax=Taibaiella koreensis TaxID=1268548 RepID=UPI000E59B18D|nr:hypothetical protein [Taibaiella koreensis]
MEEKKSLFERWIILEADLVERFGKKPNMEAILFLIGMNEYRGRVPKIKFSKEQKQELMHVAVCTLLCRGGYYMLEGYDDEGWPHFRELKKVETDQNTLAAQDIFLKEYILDYFGVD